MVRHDGPITETHELGEVMRLWQEQVEEAFRGTTPGRPTRRGGRSSRLRLPAHRPRVARRETEKDEEIGYVVGKR